MARKAVKRDKSTRSDEILPEELEGNELNAEAKQHADFVTRIRSYGDQAITALATTLEDGKPRERTAAAKIIIEHGYGKPRETIEIEGDLRIDPSALIRAVHAQRTEAGGEPE